MRGAKWLWTSIAFVGVLVVASLVGFATGALKPLLGLDLEGGVSVILQAPAGTPDTVMQQALENIRNRVDAFGVGEPQIFVSGKNIEVQLPGLAKGSIEERAKTQYCLVDPKDVNYGCVGEKAGADSALAGISVVEDTSVCMASDDLTVDNVCFGSKTEAKKTIDALKVNRNTTQGATGSWCVESLTSQLAVSTRIGRRAAGMG
jgi:preprotein translocase subunit SecD